MSLWRYQLDARAREDRRRRRRRRGMNVNERVARYLAATPPGISGNHGHSQTFNNDGGPTQ
jgi:hypothetical protein